MGRQVEFYMTYADEISFLATLQERAGVRVLRNRYRDTGDPHVRDLKPVTIRDEDSFLSLVNESIQPAIRFSREGDRTMRLIDLRESEVIEFSRCHFVDDWLASGRLWFEERTLDGPKAPRFVRWARSVVAQIRRTYKKTADGRYVGPDAVIQASVGRLRLGPPTPPPADELRRRIGLA